MLDIIQENFKRAWSKFLTWSGLISERVRVELALIRILEDLKKIDHRIGELYQITGKRLFELKERQEKNILKDEEINNALSEIQRLIEEKERLLRRASEITEVSDQSDRI